MVFSCLFFFLSFFSWVYLLVISVQRIFQCLFLVKFVYGSQKKSFINCSLGTFFILSTKNWISTENSTETNTYWTHKTERNKETQNEKFQRKLWTNLLSAYVTSNMYVYWNRFLLSAKWFKCTCVWRRKIRQPTEESKKTIKSELKR